MAQSTPATTDRPPALFVAVFVTLGLGCLLYAGTAILDQTDLRLPLLAATVLVGAAAGAGSAVHHRHTRYKRELTAALQPLLQPDDPRGMVRCRKRKAGVPTVVVVSYPPQWPDQDEKKRVELRGIVASRLGARVEATWRTKRHQVICRVMKFADDLVESDTGTPAATGDTAEQAAMRTRATDVVQAVMGPTATLNEIRFEEGSDSPTSLSFVYGTTSRDLSTPFRQKVLAQIQAKIPGDWADVWEYEKNTVQFEPRPPFPSNVQYPIEQALEYGVLQYCVGEDGELRPWLLGSKDPHHLVVGPTGSGKTVLIRNLALSAALQGIPVVLCDPKRIEYRDLADFPGITVVTGIEEIAEAIGLVSDLMQERYAAIEAGIAEEGQHGKFLLILDEYVIFKELVNEIWAVQKKEQEISGGKNHPCLGKWRNTVLMGRSAEVHCVLGLQRPDAEVVTGALRDSFRKRTALDQHTPETAKMVWDNSRIGTRLPSVQGRGMTRTMKREPEEIQVLRLLPPTTAGHSAEDVAVWERAVELASDPALWADVYIPEGILALKRRREQAVAELRARHAAPAVQLEKAPAVPQPDDEAVEDTEDAAPIASEAANAKSAAVGAPPAVESEDEDDETDSAEWEPASVYELELSDLVMIEDETGIPEIATIEDIHFEETDDGEELVEITLSGHDSGSQEVRTYPAEEMLRRRSPAG